MTERPKRVICTICVVGLVAACAATDEGVARTSTIRTTTSMADVVVPPTSPATTVSPTTVAAPSTSTATSASLPNTSISTSTTSTLPGTAIDWLVAGTRAQVPGIAWDESFTIRTLPRDDRAVAAELPPMTELVFTGAAREIATASSTRVWVEVDVGGVRGWIELWSLVYLGAVRDRTEAAMTVLGPSVSASSMLELATLVADRLDEIEPNAVGATIVRANQPTTDRRSSVVFDVFPSEDFGDDAARGGRYQIVGEEQDGRYHLIAVEVTSLCSRGVDANGACV